jgi:hypothetical protein
MDCLNSPVRTVALKYVNVPITRQIEVPLSPGMCMALSNLLFPGGINPPNKVAAIKAVRVEFDIGLREAKDIVDALTKEMLAAPY